MKKIAGRIIHIAGRIIHIGGMIIERFLLIEYLAAICMYIGLIQDDINIILFAGILLIYIMLRRILNLFQCRLKIEIKCYDEKDVAYLGELKKCCKQGDNQVAIDNKEEKLEPIEGAGYIPNEDTKYKCKICGNEFWDYELFE